MVRLRELYCAHFQMYWIHKTYWPYMKKNLKPDRTYRKRVYRIVRRIPRGRVMTYGEIAYILGEGYTPRTVGFVMHGAGDNTPWHRVINSQGSCSTGRVVLPSDKQQRMLEAEGIQFDAKGRCDLETYLWHPDQKKIAQNETAKARAALSRRNRN
jgi:methylated-DNA-protein-cysteine methyltransferase-like protein